MRIFGPLVCSTTLAETVADARASAAVVRSPPSTRSTGTSEMTSPGLPTTFSTVTTSSTATLYCLPPVLTIAYMDALLQSSGDVVRGPEGRNGLVVTASCRNPRRGAGLQGTERLSRGSNRVAPTLGGRRSGGPGRRATRPARPCGGVRRRGGRRCRVGRRGAARRHRRLGLRRLGLRRPGLDRPGLGRLRLRSLRLRRLRLRRLRHGRLARG